MKKQSVEAFKTACLRWEKNKEALGFRAIVRQKSARICVEVTDYPPEFKKSIDELSCEIATEGIRYISSMLIFPCAVEDRENQVQTIRSVLNEIVCPLLSHLFEYGFDEFDKQIANHRSILQIQYELSHLQFCPDGYWIRWNGTIWAGAAWVDKDGKESKSSVPMLDKILQSFCPC